jgi:hypothetical protein
VLAGEISATSQRADAAARERDALASEIATRDRAEASEPQVERLRKRAADLERRLDEALVDEENARAETKQLEEALLVRENAIVELHSAGEQAQRRVLELEEKLMETRAALRRGVRDRLREPQP